MIVGQSSPICLRDCGSSPFCATRCAFTRCAMRNIAKRMWASPCAVRVWAGLGPYTQSGLAVSEYRPTAIAAAARTASTMGRDRYEAIGFASSTARVNRAATSTTSLIASSRSASSECAHVGALISAPTSSAGGTALEGRGAVWDARERRDGGGGGGGG